MEQQKFPTLNDIKDILINDFTITRDQIRISLEWFVRLSLILTVTIISAFVVSIIAKPDIIEALIGARWLLFVFVNLLVLAQLSLLLNYHFFYLQLWTGYLQLVEEKLELLFQGCNLIEFERKFAPIYFGRFVHRTLIVFILLPNLMIYVVETVMVCKQLSNWCFAILIFMFFAAPIVLLLYFYRWRLDSLWKEIDKAKLGAIEEFKKWLKNKRLS